MPALREVVQKLLPDLIPCHVLLFWHGSEKQKGRTSGPAPRLNRRELLLETEPRRKLDNARIPSGRYLTERSTGYAGVRNVELRMVEHVEEVRADLQFNRFAVEIRHLAQREIDVGAIGPAESVSAKRAVGAQRRVGHCGIVVV